MGEDVELCLEVQVDPESKRILSNPNKCRSTLLDVTVVKPKEVEAFGTQRTNTLQAHEVRKLITSLEKQRRKKQKYLDKFKYDDTIIKIRKHDEDQYDSHHRSRKSVAKAKERVSPKSPIDELERKDFIGITESVEPLFCEIRRSLKNVETRITNMQDINLVISQTTVGESESAGMIYSKRKKPSPRTKHLRKHSVYRIETDPNDLKSVLLARHNADKFLDRGDKIEGKCLCENCGIVGLLAECQKHPLRAELSESPSPSHHRLSPINQPKRTRFDVSSCEGFKHRNYHEPTYVNQLSNRIQMLEERLSLQEEKVVPKDYFKKIITKMVTNFSPKLFKPKSDESLSVSEKTFKKLTKPERAIKHSPPRSEKAEKIQVSKSIQAVKCLNATISYRNLRHKHTQTKNDKATITEDEVLYGGNIWRWGEEILRPGIDLKNRIVTLVNDILSKFVVSENCSTETTKAKEAESYNPETIKKFMKQMKVFNAQIDPKSTFLFGDQERKERHNHCEHLPCSAIVDYTKRVPDSGKYSKSIDVSYVNPKISTWRKESANVCKVGSKLSEKKTTSTMVAGKQEFLKIISKAKQQQKDILWKNIWNQAKANGQSKNDKITIKIPFQQNESKSGNEMFETELSIREVEGILKGV